MVEQPKAAEENYSPEVSQAVDLFRHLGIKLFVVSQANLSKALELSQDLGDKILLLIPLELVKHFINSKSLKFTFESKPSVIELGKLINLIKVIDINVLTKAIFLLWPKFYENEESVRTQIIEQIKKLKSLPFTNSAREVGRQILIDLDRTLIDTDQLIDEFIYVLQSFGIKYRLPYLEKIRQAYQAAYNNFKNGFYHPGLVITEFMSNIGWSQKYQEPLLEEISRVSNIVRPYDDSPHFISALKEFFGDRDFFNHVSIFTTGVQEWQTAKINTAFPNTFKPKQIRALTDKTSSEHLDPNQPPSVPIDDSLAVITKLSGRSDDPRLVLFWLNRNEISLVDRDNSFKSIAKTGVIIEIQTLTDLIPFLCPGGINYHQRELE